MTASVNPLARAIPPENEALLAQLARWREQNFNPGPELLWRRRSVLLSQLIQRLGINREVSAPLFFGGRMRVVTGEEVSRGVLTFGYTELALTALMLHTLQSGDVMIDVGTQFAYEALLACRLVGENGLIVCFEPSRNAHALATRNLRGKCQVILRQEAVAAAAGTLTIEDRPVAESAFNSVGGRGDGRYSNTLVRAVTLDDVLGDLPALGDRRIRLIKVDVEGFEHEVVAGAGKVLEHHRPLLVLEADMPLANGEPSARAWDLARQLEPLGYQPFAFDYDGTFRVAPLGTMAVGHANIAFVPAEMAAAD